MSSAAPTQAAYYLLDTNILLRLTDSSSTQHEVVKKVVAALITSGSVLFITAQNLVEFWAVATRPLENNGLGFTRTEALSEIAKHKSTFRFLTDSPEVFKQWELLVGRYEVQGKNTHDARLAAVALAYEVPFLLTLNERDFKRFAPEGLDIIDPATIYTSLNS